mmetsp:Transcript_11509/g.16880  ORF Transcript_11509/g.16880 Transcript_11509/m.16880 type:complete len:574 (-) Transcript_11509:1409-3130(-)|eukprot:CAMPEP_0194207722 /NCGR_PEP_ID=MMETSP0156-20130528/6382_1 /TAXON_ID=33649 /ORGANISM="Thalassionema nitzschioides, Strain L26-B" /LENGTH=573 /DNA_ID=CAMNT_0038934549 /DNA_START=140 /DNA_END=1861 /DNA_ORIENTATION=-
MSNWNPSSTTSLPASMRKRRWGEKNESIESFNHPPPPPPPPPRYNDGIITKSSEKDNWNISSLTSNNDESSWHAPPMHSYEKVMIAHQHNPHRRNDLQFFPENSAAAHATTYPQTSFSSTIPPPPPPPPPPRLPYSATRSSEFEHRPPTSYGSLGTYASLGSPNNFEIKKNYPSNPKSSAEKEGNNSDMDESEEGSTSIRPFSPREKKPADDKDFHSKKRPRTTILTADQIKTSQESPGKTATNSASKQGGSDIISKNIAPTTNTGSGSKSQEEYLPNHKERALIDLTDQFEDANEIVLAIKEKVDRDLSANLDHFEDAEERTHQLLKTKEKLRNARAKLVSALKRRNTMSPQNTGIPSITAMKQPLKIASISGPDELVRFEDEITLYEWELIIVPVEESDDEGSEDGNHDVSTIKPNLVQHRETIRKNLLLLKKKKLELELKKKQHESASQGSTGKQPGRDKEPHSRVTKEALRKRQEELQQTVDAAYWKRLLIKQRNLLIVQQKTVKDHESKLASCRDLIQRKRKSIAECQNNIETCLIRESYLEKRIALQTRAVLAARERRKRKKQRKHD